MPEGPKGIPISQVRRCIRFLKGNLGEDAARFEKCVGVKAGLPARRAVEPSEAPEETTGDVARAFRMVGSSLSSREMMVYETSEKLRPYREFFGRRGAFSSYQAKIIKGLIEQGTRVRAYDPVAGKVAARVLGDTVELVTRNYDALDGADGLVIVTEWNEFRYPDFKRMADLMNERVIFDGRNIYNPKTMREHGFAYYSIGRP